MKYCYYNAVTFSDVFSLFGDKNTLNQKGKVKTFHKSAIDLNGLDECKLEKCFQIPLKEYNNQLLINILSPLSSGRIMNFKYIEKNLKYCPLCLANKFHSNLHQFAFIHKCPFHTNTKLLNRCPKCNIMIPYNLNNNGSINNKYSCRSCGFIFSKEKKFTSNTPNTKIMDKEVSSWLNLSSKDQKKINNSIIFDELYLKNENEVCHHKYDISFLNSCLNPTKTSLKHKNEGLFIDGRLVRERLRKAPYLKNIEAYEESFESYDTQYSYKSADKLFQSIARHFRKTILKNHIGCIKELTRYRCELEDEQICPFAIAYVYWRYRLQSFKSYEYVDNWGRPPLFRSHISDYGYPVEAYRFNWWLRDIEEKNVLPSSISSARSDYIWILNNFLGELIFAEFYRCLEYAINWTSTQNEKYTIDSIYTFKYMNKILITKEGRNYYMIKEEKNDLTELKQKLPLIFCPKGTLKEIRTKINSQSRYVKSDLKDEILKRMNKRFKN